MLKVWLDDERPMPEGFDLWVKNYDQAISVLKEGRVSFLSFDHDLGQGKTGYDVACWIEEAYVLRGFGKIGWAVHSMNPVGAARIKTVMERLDYAWEKNSNKKGERP